MDRTESEESEVQSMQDELLKLSPSAWSDEPPTLQPRTTASYFWRPGAGTKSWEISELMGFEDDGTNYWDETDEGWISVSERGGQWQAVKGPTP